MKAKKTNDFNKRISLLLSIVLVLIIAITPISYATSDLSRQVEIESSTNQTTQNNQNQQQNTTQRQQEQRHSDNLDTTQDIPANLFNNTNNTNTSANNTQTNQVRNEVITPVISTEVQTSEPPRINEFDQVEDPLDIHADSCILIEPNSTKVLYEKNSAKKVYPASTTKLLTAILTTEFVNDLNEKALVSYYAVKSVPPTYSIANLQPGEQVSINDLLNSLLVGSANDSAYVLAQYIINHGNNFPYDESYDSEKNFNNSIEQFAELMNRRAKELGCKDSNFRNPNGIHDDFHYSTARDLAIIGRTAYKNPVLSYSSENRSPCLQRARSPHGLRRGLFRSPCRGLHLGFRWRRRRLREWGLCSFLPDSLLKDRRSWSFQHRLFLPML